jgi:TPR repeat protein
MFSRICFVLLTSTVFVTSLQAGEPPDLITLTMKAESGDAVAQRQLGDFYFKDENIEDAKGWYEKAAAQGDALAMRGLGDCHWFEWNESTAMEWWAKAAALGDAEAQYCMRSSGCAGINGGKGYGLPEDWLKKSAEQGYAPAQFQLGELYSKGEGLPKDAVQAAVWYRKAAEQGNAEAQYALGRCYAEGNGVAQELNHAVEWYKRAAEQGHSEARTSLAHCYYSGVGGLPKDVVKALMWFGGTFSKEVTNVKEDMTPEQIAEAKRLADTFVPKPSPAANPVDKRHRRIEDGDPPEYVEQQEAIREKDAQALRDELITRKERIQPELEKLNHQAIRELGAFYRSGDGGLEQNLGEAAKWLRQASGWKDAEAQYELALLGFIGAIEPGEAISGLTEAAQAGHAEAQRTLGYCYQTGFSVPQDMKKAAEWYSKAAERGNVLAQNALGDCCANGKGVTKDMKQAVDWYKKAAERGYVVAQNNLGECYRKGVGVPRDYVNAAVWFKLANRGDTMFSGAHSPYEMLMTQDQSNEAEERASAFVPTPPMPMKGMVPAEDESADDAKGQSSNKAPSVANPSSSDAESAKKGELAEATFEVLHAKAEEGDSQAQYYMGCRYCAGDDVPKDTVEAYRWFNLAAGQGNAKAGEWRDALEQKMTLKDIARAQKISSEFTPKIPEGK